MTKTFEFHGHTVVSPILGKGRELIDPLEDYFPSFPIDINPIVEWFGLDEQKRKDYIRERDDHKCLFCEKAVDSDEVHEIIGKGAAGGEPALVPWNQLTVCRQHHELLQQYKWTIYHFDPLDKENGLIVIGQDGSPIEKNMLWFYNRPDKEIVEEAHRRYQEMQEALAANRHNEARFTEHSVWMRAHKGAESLGLGTHKAMLAQINADTARDHKLCTLYERALERGMWDEVKTIDFDRAYKILKTIKIDDGYGWLIPDDHLAAWFADARMLSSGDFNQKFSEAFGVSRPHKGFAINGATQVYEIEIDDPDKTDADMIIEGGKVIKGKVG